MLDELIKAMEIIPKQYRPAAIHDMTTFAEFVISKYTALAAKSNKNQTSRYKAGQDIKTPGRNASMKIQKSVVKTKSAR